MFVMTLVSVVSAGAYDVLKLRDGADCAALGTGPAVRDELITLAEGDVAPSYVPVRAAECLVEGFAADPVVVARAKAWVVEGRWAGLGILVAEEEARFSTEDAVAIARAAVAGSDPRVRERVVRRFLKSERGDVRSVVDESAGGR
jgi:hypothetical protein